jgi:hypothetical protein
MFINPEFKMPLSVMVPQNCSASEFGIYVATAMDILIPPSLATATRFQPAAT